MEIPMLDHDRAQADNDSLLFEEWMGAEWTLTVPPARSDAGSQVRQVAPTRCVGLFARARSRLQRWRATQRTIAALEVLDDHLLKDIGIHRCQIGSAARQGTFRQS
jgi:uncharacterized protein YjiS (DUF1127 family)